jgi:hypothetical protein
MRVSHAGLVEGGITLSLSHPPSSASPVAAVHGRRTFSRQKKFQQENMKPMKNMNFSFLHRHPEQAGLVPALSKDL